MRRLRVGLISVMNPEDYNHVSPSTFEAAVRDHQSAAAALDSMGFEVIKASEGLTRTNPEYIEHGKYLRNHDADVLVIYVYQWLYAASAVDLARIVNVPVIIWTHSYRNTQGQKVGIVGGGICRGALDAAGFTVKLIHGSFDDTCKLKKIERYVRGYGLVSQLKNTAIGVGGTMSMGMFPAQADVAEMQGKFGVRIDGFDERSLIERSLEIPDKEAQDFLLWMEREFGRITAKPEVMLAQIKMYLAMLKLIRENDYSAVCVRCLPDLPEHHTTFCLAHSFLNCRTDAYGDKQTIVCGCEADVLGTLTMQALKCVSGGAPVFFGDVAVLDYDDNIIYSINCPSAAFDFAPSRKHVEWQPEIVLQFKWKMGGAHPSFIAAPGKVTVARLAKKGGAYRLMIASGELVEKPAKYDFSMIEIDPGIPACDSPDAKCGQFYIKLDSPMDNMVDALRSNHLHLVRGDYVSELLIYCEAAGIIAELV